MENDQEIKIKPVAWSVLVEERFKRCLNEHENMRKVLDTKQGVIFDIVHNDVNKCSFMIENFEDAIHLREVGGDFLPYMNVIHRVCEYLLTANKLDRITCCASRPAIGKFLEKFGLVRDNEDNTYKRTYT